MSLIERPATNAGGSALAIRQVAGRMSRNLAADLRAMAGAVKRGGGRAAVAAALGPGDAAELVAVYGKARALLAALGETVDDLPA
jgi:hypothetical protein